MTSMFAIKFLGDFHDVFAAAAPSQAPFQSVWCTGAGRPSTALMRRRSSHRSRRRWMKARWLDLFFCLCWLIDEQDLAFQHLGELFARRILFTTFYKY